jgi:DNA-directed RNA polymerase specialized sigma24 family protein
MKSELTNAPNAELCAVARGGNQQAYAELVLRFRPQMRASLRAALARSRHWTRNRADDIPDLLQELQVLLLRQGPRFLSTAKDGVDDVPPEARFRAAAKRVARSYLRSGRRSAWAELPGADDIEALTVTDRTEEVLLARDSLRRTFSGVSGRGQGSAAIVHALYVEGRALDEVCLSWRVSRNSVYCATRRFRAHARALATGERERGQPWIKEED